jgi:hypothetical protein
VVGGGQSFMMEATASGLPRRGRIEMPQPP